MLCRFVKLCGFDKAKHFIGMLRRLGNGFGTGNKLLLGGFCRFPCANLLKAKTDMQGDNNGSGNFPRHGTAALADIL